MALVKETLKQGIEAMLNNLQQGQDREQAISSFADGLADLIDSYIKTATVSTTVTGVCATPAGPGTISGTGTGTLS